MPSSPQSPPRTLFAGLFFTTLAIILLELGLTRLYSVIFWYHFAFMSVSLALFGQSAAGIFLYVFQDRFEAFGTNEFAEFRRPKTLSRLTTAFAFSVLALGGILLNWSVNPTVTPAGMARLAVVYCLSAIPFFLGGLATSLVLSRYTAFVRKLYFYDLLGASAGCLLLIPLLNALGGVKALFAVSLLALVGAACFEKLGSPGLPSQSLRWMALLGGLFLVNLAAPVLSIHYAKGLGIADIFDAPPIFEGWNSFSQIGIYHWSDEGFRGYHMTPNPQILEHIKKASPVPLPAGSSDLDKMKQFRHYTDWARSETYPGPFPQQLLLLIDGAAGTMISRFSGDINELKYQEYEITSLAYHLRPESDVLIIGPGGGPDVLTALRFKSKSVTGVELNPQIFKAVNNELGDFTNHLYSTPPVHVVVDEGRSFIRRSERKWEIIQASLIDTWAANAAGAYTLSENTLYTIEAFRDFLQHLNPDGLFTMSRFHSAPPQQSLRMVSLALEALHEEGVAEPWKQVMVIKKDNVDTLLMKHSPFTPQEVKRINDLADKLHFDKLYLPGQEGGFYFQMLITAPDREKIYQQYLTDYGFDVSPCGDDKPFFFNAIRFRDVGKVLAARMKGQVEEGQSWNYDAVIILLSLFSLSLFLVALFILGPSALKFRSSSLKPQAPSLKPFPLIVYFSSLGLGFMMVEIALMQKCILFLGHPVYALTVILFALLLSSSLGSRFSARFEHLGHKQVAGRALAGLIGVAFVWTLVVIPLLFSQGMGWPLPLRIAVVVLVVFPLGLLMGVPFPVGLHWVHERRPELVPWIWGVNGATSVLGSIGAFMLAMGVGFTMTLYSGQVVYAVALVALMGWREE